MFRPDEQVLCIDDTFPNPDCRFPNGYVVQGQVYRVVGTFRGGGVDIAGLPVFNLKRLEEVGWKAQRFRRLSDPYNEEGATDAESLELVSTGGVKE